MSRWSEGRGGMTAPPALLLSEQQVYLKQAEMSASAGFSVSVCTSNEGCGVSRTIMQINFSTRSFRVLDKWNIQIDTSTYKEGTEIYWTGYICKSHPITFHLYQVFILQLGVNWKSKTEPNSSRNIAPSPILHSTSIVSHVDKKQFATSVQSHQDGNKFK